MPKRKERKSIETKIRTISPFETTINPYYSVVQSYAISDRNRSEQNRSRSKPSLVRSIDRPPGLLILAPRSLEGGLSPRFWETQRQYALRKYARHSLSLFLSSFRSARRRRPLALENGQYPCKLNCADVSVKLKRMENRFSRARAPVPFSCLREFHPREDPSLDPIERSGGEERYLGFSFREFARNEGKKRIFVIFLFERKEVLDEIRNFLLFCLVQLRMCDKIFCLVKKKEFYFSWNENLWRTFSLSLSRLVDT